jgi:MFS superfamily sulfate permease-like transporter
VTTLVILGVLVLVGALLFSDSMATLFRLFPMPVLGVILFFGGMELARVSQWRDVSRGRSERCWWSRPESRPGTRASPT